MSTVFFEAFGKWLPMCFFLFSCTSNLQRQKTIPKTAGALKNLSEPLRGQFRLIVSNAITGGPLLEKDYFRFWDILKKAKIESESDVERLKAARFPTYYLYQPLLWADAKKSLQTGTPFRSEKRQKFENSLLKSGQMDRAQISSSQKFIENVAGQKTIREAYGDRVVDKRTVDETLESLKKTRENLDKLFTPPEGFLQKPGSN